MMATDRLQIGKPSIINRSQLSASQIVIKFQSLFNVFIAEREWQSLLQRKLNYAALQQNVLGSRFQQLCTVKIAIYFKLHQSLKPFKADHLWPYLLGARIAQFRFWYFLHNSLWWTIHRTHTPWWYIYSQGNIENKLIMLFCYVKYN